MSEANKKIISIEVRGEYILGSGVSIGAMGSFDAMVLQATFDESWVGLTKYATWTDALGNVGEQILFTELDRAEDTSTYTYNIPVTVFPLRHAGTVELSFTGYVVGDGKIKSAINTATGTFRVLESNAIRIRDDGVDASIADQLHITESKLAASAFELNEKLEEFEIAELERDEAENGYTDINGDFVFGRVQNEEARISAEGKRQEYYKDVDTIVGIIKDTQNAIIEGGGDAIISFIHPYPVGSIYISINETDPGTLFGGTWERLKDRFLLSAGDTYSAGATGGSADAVLLKHTHNIIDNSTQQNFFNAKIGLGGDSVPAGGGWVLSTEQGTNGYYHRESELIEKSTNRIIATNPLPSSVDGTIADSGTGGNMPPYLTVYMWKRIA